jgi:hypothetical protein
MRPNTAAEGFRFQSASQTSGRSFPINSRDLSMKQINGYWDLGVGRVTPSIAQKFSKRDAKCRENLGNRPTKVSGEVGAVRSPRDTWCAIGLHRLLAPRNFKEEELAPSSRETRSAERISGPGPQHRREEQEPLDLEGHVVRDWAPSPPRPSQL